MSSAEHLRSPQHEAARRHGEQVRASAAAKRCPAAGDQREPSREKAAVPRLRVASIDFLNTAPLVWGLESEPRLQLFRTLPSSCAEALRAGTAEIGIVPVIEVARIGGLVVIPGIAIAASSQVRSILLISRCRADRIRTVALDRSSRTSVALVQILLRERFGARFTTVNADPEWRTMLDGADAALLIGDPALKLGLSGEAQSAGMYVYDLASEWHRWTGFGFVFAVWAVRTSAIDSASAGWVVERFQRAKQEGLEHLDAIAASWSERLRLPRHEIVRYLTENVEYDLTFSNAAGLARFFELAKDAGLLSSATLPQFIHTALRSGGADLPASTPAAVNG